MSSFSDVTNIIAQELNIHQKELERYLVSGATITHSHPLYDYLKNKANEMEIKYDFSDFSATYSGVIITSFGEKVELVFNKKLFNYSIYKINSITKKE